MELVKSLLEPYTVFTPFAYGLAGGASLLGLAIAGLEAMNFVNFLRGSPKRYLR